MATALITGSARGIGAAVALEGPATGTLPGGLVGVLYLLVQALIIGAFCGRGGSPLLLVHGSRVHVGRLRSSVVAYFPLRPCPDGQQNEQKKKERHGSLHPLHGVFLLLHFSASYHTDLLFSAFSMFVYNLFQKNPIVHPLAIKCPVFRHFWPLRLSGPPLSASAKYGIMCYIPRTNMNTNYKGEKQTWQLI